MLIKEKQHVDWVITLTLKRKNFINDPIVRTAGVDVAKIVIKDFGWYISQITPSSENQQILMGQFLIKDPAELYYMERTVFTKDENTNNTWTFELGSYGKSPPTFVIVGFQDRNKIDSQTHDKEISDRLPISNAVCNMGSGKYPDDGIECFYDRDNYQLSIIF